MPGAIALLEVRVSRGQVGHMASKKSVPVRDRDYMEVFDDVTALLVSSRTAAAQTVNILMASTYWLIGR